MDNKTDFQREFHVSHPLTGSPRAAAGTEKSWEFGAMPGGEFNGGNDPALEFGGGRAEEKAAPRRKIADYMRVAAALLATVLVADSFSLDILADTAQDVLPPEPEREIAEVVPEPEPVNEPGPEPEPVSEPEPAPEEPFVLVYDTYENEGGVITVTVYNDSVDPGNDWGNRVLLEETYDEDAFPAALALPEPYTGDFTDGYEPAGYAVVCREGGERFARQLEEGRLTYEEVCWVPPVDGARRVEVYVLWNKTDDDITFAEDILTLDANGGEGTVTVSLETPMASEGMIFLCKYPVPVREGYTFTGWYETPLAVGEPVDFLEVMSFFTNTKDDGYGNIDIDWSAPAHKTLYAGWR